MELESKEKTPQEESPNNKIIITEDGKITFEIINKVNVSQEELDQIKKDILHSYKIVTESIHTEYKPADKITIHLLNGNKASSGYRYAIKLYSSAGNPFPLVHELTHTLLGYGNNFDASNGYLTQEGFGVYMENKYGKNVTPVHKFMRYFIDHNKNIPIEKLMDKNYGNSLFRPLLAETEDYVLMNISYMHAGSFVTYLIDTYGLEKFDQLYNKSETEKRLTEIYGMSTEELENEWIQYVKKNIKFTSDDRLQLESFYLINDTLDSINPEIFKKE